MNASDKPKSLDPSGSPAQVRNDRPDQPIGETADTRTSQSDGPVPRMPHERDESADSQQKPQADDIGEQAFEDVERGIQDTSYAPVTDQVYQRQADRDDGPPRT